MNFYDQIFFQAALDPLRPAIAYPGGLSTYGMITRSANIVASNLIDMGIQEGQICTIRIPDPLLHLVVILGLGRIGAASLSMADTKPLDSFGLNISANFVSSSLEGDQAERIHIIDERIYSECKLSCIYTSKINGYIGNETTVLAVSMSSGTTGMPKAIGLTNQILNHRVQSGINNRDNKRSLCMMGFDTFGGYWNAIQTLRGGGMVCFAPNSALVFEMAGFFNISDIIASPAQIMSLLDEQKKRARSLPELRNIYTGGAQLPADTQIDCERLFHAKMMIAYGSTEVGAITLAPSTLSMPGARTNGFILPSLDVEIVSDEGRPLPPQREGLIRIKGPGVINGYLNATETDASIFQNGWFYPGDLGKIDGIGMLHVTGRAGIRINRGGVKIAPEIIEDILSSHPGIQECAVTGLETVDGRVRIVVALIRNALNPSDEDLRLYCSSKIPDKMPDDFFDVPEIPKTSMGKIARQELKELLRDIYITAA